MTNEKKSSSKLGSGLMIGAILGIAAATFLQSRTGKGITRDLQKKMMALQKKLNVELQKVKVMSKDGYESLVDNVISYYVKSKDVAQSDVPAVKKELMSSWKSIEKEMISGGNKIASTAKKAVKKMS